MSMTLNLVDRLLSMGRNFQRLGRDRDAQHVLQRLAGLHDLPPAINEETQVRLAEILLREARYTKARRHLTALLVQCPTNARYHYLMATALEKDERADPRRAADHYRKSLELEPNQPRCLGELGLLQLRLGDTEGALGCLRKAVEIAPNDPEAAGRLAEGLRQAGCDAEALSALRIALFRNARDARFRKLYNDFQFRLLHEEQQRQRAELPALDLSHPHILPFVAGGTEISGERVVRRDGPAIVQPPHAPRIAGKKHA